MNGLVLMPFVVELRSATAVSPVRLSKQHSGGSGKKDWLDHRKRRPRDRQPCRPTTEQNGRPCELVPRGPLHPKDVCASVQSLQGLLTNEPGNLTVAEAKVDQLGAAGYASLVLSPSDRLGGEWSRVMHIRSLWTSGRIVRRPTRSVETAAVLCGGRGPTGRTGLLSRDSRVCPFSRHREKGHTR